MNYEILTGRWPCPECDGPLRLTFSRRDSMDDEAPEEFVCDRVLCEQGHVISDQLAEEIILQADEEFYAPLERGHQVAQVWQAPQNADTDIQDQMPPEMNLGHQS